VNDRALRLSTDGMNWVSRGVSSSTVSASRSQVPGLGVGIKSEHLGVVEESGYGGIHCGSLGRTSAWKFESRTSCMNW